MGTAATNFLESLDAEQRRGAQWPFPSDDERRRWYYTPTDHGGLPLSRMRPAQQQLVFKLLAEGLSRAAYVTACTIIGLDNVLDELEGWVRSWGRERGRDPGLYYLRIFGNPGSGDWSWRFGGHHVSIHHLVAGDRVAATTPLFLGADPARAPLLGGDELRPLGRTEDLGRELFASLAGEDRRRALLSAIPPYDLVTGNHSVVRRDMPILRLPEIWRGRFEGEQAALLESVQRQLEESLATTEHDLDAVRFTPEPKGLPARDMTHGQRQLLRELLRAYVGRLPDDVAAAEMERYAGEGIEPLAFAWAGSDREREPHYYRLQGPRLLVEYDNAQRAGNHAHSVLRDLESDFGMNLTATRRAAGKDPST